MDYTTQVAFCDELEEIMKLATELGEQAPVAASVGGLGVPTNTALKAVAPPSATAKEAGSLTSRLGAVESQGGLEAMQEKTAIIGALGGIGKALSSVGRLGKAAIKGKVKMPGSLGGAKSLAQSTGRHLKTQFARGAAAPSLKNVALGTGAVAGLGGFAAGRMSKRREPAR